MSEEEADKPLSKDEIRAKLVQDIMRANWEEIYKNPDNPEAPLISQFQLITINLNKIMGQKIAWSNSQTFPPKPISFECLLVARLPSNLDSVADGDKFVYPGGQPIEKEKIRNRIKIKTMELMQLDGKSYKPRKWTFEPIKPNEVANAVELILNKMIRDTSDLNRFPGFIEKAFETDRTISLLVHFTGRWGSSPDNTPVPNEQQPCVLLTEFPETIRPLPQ